MSEESKKEKIEIEDILDDDREIDLDSVVSEEKETVIEESEEKISDAIDELADTGQKDVLEEAIEQSAEEKSEVKTKKEKKSLNQKSKKWLKIFLLVVLTAIVTSAAVLGAIYFMGQKDEITEDAVIEEETVIEEVVEEEEPDDKFVYISSEVGLNLREAPDTKSKVLIIIPYSVKIPVLDEQSGWIKTEYDSKTGWVSADFTQVENPLIYENKTYGFSLNFKPSWAGYRFFSANNPGSEVTATYYVALPTSDKNWDETSAGIEKGYASLFVMGVYTKAKWAEIAGGEMLPAKLGESDKYVYTYLPGQAYATDLKTQYYEINEIIKTFETL
jgi:uncharacterized protein YgiM (DUF1202 family)